MWLGHTHGLAGNILWYWPRRHNWTYPWPSLGNASYPYSYPAWFADSLGADPQVLDAFQRIAPEIYRQLVADPRESAQDQLARLLERYMAGATPQLAL